ncbi:MAG: sodium:calcium antiporter [Candidatus Nealsonbacteria bacterium]|nr:sodium:calcium antiporter [Candidatus Nealsonbacteria bacterium]
MILLYILIFITAILLLTRSGAWAVQDLSRIARYLGWSEFVVAFILMAFVSSIPEFFIGISSVIHKVPEVSFGNIIGANVINLTLAVGLAVVFIGGLSVDRKIVQKDSTLTAISAFLPLILILDKELSRIDGIILLLGFLAYIFWLFSQKDRFSRIYNNSKEGLKQFIKNIFALLGSVFLLFLSAEAVIRSSTILAKEFGIPHILIGILIIGTGTALPETYFVVRAALKHKKEMILGNLMGCVVVTSLFVLGFVALLSPIKINDFSPYFSARIFLLISIVSFLIILRTGNKITRKESLLLISIYLAFVAAEILFK